MGTFQLPLPQPALDLLYVYRHRPVVDLFRFTGTFLRLGRLGADRPTNERYSAARPVAGRRSTAGTATSIVRERSRGELDDRRHGAERFGPNLRRRLRASATIIRSRTAPNTVPDDVDGDRIYERSLFRDRLCSIPVRLGHRSTEVRDNADPCPH
jgi:hypothetical protein